MISNSVIVFASVTTAAATAVIAWFTWKSCVVYSQLKGLEEKRQTDDDKRQQEIKDLYQAIVIATVLGGGHPGSKIGEIEAFKSMYKGLTKIF